MRKDNKKIGEKIRKTILLITVGSNTAIGLVGILGIIIVCGKYLLNSRTDRDIFIASISVTLVFIIASIILSTVLSKHISGKISKPIEKLAEAAEQISKGNLAVDIEVNSNDETGALAQSFQKMIDALQLMQSDVNMLISEAMEGSLDKRADASLHEGGYREIIEEVNALLDTVKAPLDVVMDFTKKLADGEHQQDIDSTYKGKFSDLMDNLNAIRSAVEILETEADKLALAGQNGDLAVRGDTVKLKGVFRQIIEGVNETFDSFKAPLDVASDYIAKIASGDSLDMLDNPYKGYYAQLIDHLNMVRASLYSLSEESSKLAQAGENGNLSIRGDLSRVKGGYAQIIDGFNKTLDSIVKPITEAENVLAKMAHNDYSMGMSDGYQGMLKEFAVNINDVRERLLAIEKILVEVGDGSDDSLERLQKIGKRSENDRMVPSFIAMILSIRNMVTEAERLASATIEGNLSVRGDESKFQGSYLRVIKAMNQTMSTVAEPIEESSAVLQKVADGDLTAEMRGEYKGEYNRIKLSLNHAVRSFHDLITEISVAADQVAAGSRQVSDASQSLSQGATEQASSVEELTSSLTEIAVQTKENASNASKASTFSMEVKTEADHGNQQMGQMLDSMREINESASSIAKIIKVIDDIAFQTNILALNAAVEAARAGQYGKGFAVVAEEVRSLAEKSAVAAKDTTELIEGSIQRVGAGTKIANDTAEKLNLIAESAQKAAALVSNIATASGQQASAITQIDQGVSQVSTVVQTNSATAEESAASSEELSGQANLLSELVGKFIL